MDKLTRKILATLLVIISCVAAVQSAKFLFRPNKGDPLKIVSRRVAGNPEADIHVIEYVDFRCGPCSRTTMWFKSFIEEHPDALYVELRYFPLHLSHGALSARFAECALDQDKFWPVAYALMAQQSKWVRLANEKPYFFQIAKEAGLDTGRLESCWDDPGLYDAIMAIKDTGKDMGVKATPTYFINGEMVVGIGKIEERLQELLGIESKKETGQK